MSGNIQGALWLLVSCLLGVITNVGARALAGLVSSTEMTFVRCLIGLVISLPFVMSFGGLASLHTARWRLHLARGVMGMLSANLGFYALTTLPLTTVTALFFTSPLFVTLFAIPLLGENVGWRRWSASIAGFAGSVIVINPSPAGVDPAMLIAIGSAAAYSFVLLFGKQLSVTDRPANLMFYLGAITTLASVPGAALTWSWPSPLESMLLLAIGTSAAVQGYTDIKGYAVADASAISPVQYVRIVFIALAAYTLFDEKLEWNTVVGAAIIIGSAVYIAHREAKLSRQRRQAAGQPGIGT